MDTSWVNKMSDIQLRRVCFYFDCLESNNLITMVANRHVFANIVSQYIRTHTDFRLSHVTDKYKFDSDIFDCASSGWAFICVCIITLKSTYLRINWEVVSYSLTKQTLTKFRPPSIQYFHFFLQLHQKNKILLKYT